MEQNTTQNQEIWYKIPDPVGKNFQCSVDGCILSAVVTNGIHALCNQHNTRPAHDSAGLQRPFHGPASHKPTIACVFCGTITWYQVPGAYGCDTCYPRADPAHMVDRTSLVLPIADSPLAPADYLKKLPHGK